MAKVKTARKAATRRAKARSVPARRPSARKTAKKKKTVRKKIVPKKAVPKKTVKQDGKEATLYDRLCQDFRDMLHRAETGKVHLKAKEIPWERNRHALLRYYLHPLIKDTALPTMQVFENVISKHGGMHRHQGGVVIFVLEGKGYSLVDGQRFDWEAGDLLLLPMKPGGVDHQHFNLEPDKPSRWLAFISNSFREHTGYEIVQVEESPEWKGVSRA